MIRILFMTLASCLLLSQSPGSGLAQWSQKPISDWSAADAESVLTNSPWVRSESVFLTSERSPALGETITFRIRLLSALPLREALKRRKQSSKDEWLTSWMNKLAKDGPGDFIIVAVGRQVRLTQNTKIDWILPLNYPTPPDTFLEVDDGRQVQMHAYKRTQDLDYLGIYVFPRSQDGKAFVSADARELRFRTRFFPTYSGGPTRRTAVETKFDLKDLIYDGRLEY